MFRIISSSWPLFFGFSLIMIANGLQGTLLGVRATIEGFDTAIIGLIMSIYYFGFLAGSYYVPKMLSKVGHIRVFTALGSLASATVLLHGLYPDPWLWVIIRGLSGFAFAGLYIVVESWLNDTSSKNTRGKIFGIYQIISYGGTVLGQIFLTFAPPSEIDLFIIASVLVSLALLPICLSSRPAPDFNEPDHLSLKKLFKISPLGIVGSFAAGMGAGSVFGIGAVYASQIGMSIPQISTFIALFVLGGVTSQLPIGWLSDRYDRRYILIGTALLASIMAVICFLASEHPLYLNIMIFFLGGLSLPIYGLSIAHITDHLNPNQYVAGSSSSILVNGLGATIGPLTISLMMKTIGTDVYFLSIAIVYMTLFAYGLYRAQKRKGIPLKEQADHVTMPLRPSPISMTITEEGHAIITKLKKD